MSREKLTVIVTCTDRKSASPEHALMVRNLPPGRVRTRARVWREAIERSTATRALIDLYSGETWTQVKRLITTATDIGFDPDIMVASAGLGLRPISDFAPAYAATFSNGHADSIAVSTREAREWWQALPHAEVKPQRRAICVLSDAYSRVIYGDLIERIAPDDLLVFGGSNDVPDHVRISSDRALRRALGGTVTSLNVRAATQWLLLSRRTDPFADTAKDTWFAWSERMRHDEVYDRQPLTDSAVVAFVHALRRRHPEITRTGALKALREAGMACEQRRFSTLFQQAVAQ